MRGGKKPPRQPILAMTLDRLTVDDVVPSLVFSGTQFTSNDTYQLKIIPCPIYSAWTNPDAHVQEFRNNPNQWGKEWSQHNEPLLFHLEGCNFRMREEFHAISPRMHICQTRGSLLQTLLESANIWTCLYVFESHQQAMDKKVEVYYEHILKLTNYLQHKMDNSLFTTFFWARLVFIYG
jgi:hypothetical protein